MYNMSLSELMTRKGVSQNKTLYDFMGIEELAGNLFRVTQTAAKVKNEKLQGLTALASTAKSVGAQVRNIMISNSGVAPESLPAHEHIDKVRGRLKRTAKAMKKLDGKKKAKPALSARKPPRLEKPAK